MDGVLSEAPTPELGRRLSTAWIAAALRRGGRQRDTDKKASEIRDALREPQSAAPPLVADAHGDTTKALVQVIAALNAQVAQLEDALAQRFEQHPDAKLYLSLRGLGVILGARVLAEFGDDPNRYAHAKARKDYAGSGKYTPTVE